MGRRRRHRVTGGIDPPPQRASASHARALLTVVRQRHRGAIERLRPKARQVGRIVRREAAETLEDVDQFTVDNIQTIAPLAIKTGAVVGGAALGAVMSGGVGVGAGATVGSALAAGWGEVLGTRAAERYLEGAYRREQRRKRIRG